MYSKRLYQDMGVDLERLYKNHTQIERAICSSIMTMITNK